MNTKEWLSLSPEARFERRLSLDRNVLAALEPAEVVDHLREQLPKPLPVTEKAFRAQNMREQQATVDSIAHPFKDYYAALGLLKCREDSNKVREALRKSDELKDRVDRLLAQKPIDLNLSGEARRDASWRLNRPPKTTKVAWIVVAVLLALGLIAAGYGYFTGQLDEFLSSY